MPLMAWTGFRKEGSRCLNRTPSLVEDGAPSPFLGTDPPIQVGPLLVHATKDQEGGSLHRAQLGPFTIWTFNNGRRNTALHAQGDRRDRWCKGLTHRHYRKVMQAHPVARSGISLATHPPMFRSDTSAWMFATVRTPRGPIPVDPLSLPQRALRRPYHRATFHHHEPADG